MIAIVLIMSIFFGALACVALLVRLTIKKRGRRRLPPLLNPEVVTPPGNYLLEQILSNRNKFDDVLLYLVGACLFFSMALTSLIVSITVVAGETLSLLLLLGPIVYVLLLLLSIALVVHFARRARGHLNKRLDYETGYKAEMLVAHELTRGLMGREGYYVFHDVKPPGSKENIDHLVVGPCGVFVVETKGRTRLEGKKARIEYDGERLQFSDGYDDHLPVKQAERIARNTETWLSEAAGLRKVSVKPILVYPGWYIDFRKAIGRQSRVYVVPLEKLSHRILDAAESLGAGERQRIVYQIDREVGIAPEKLPGVST